MLLSGQKKIVKQLKKQINQEEQKSLIQFIQWLEQIYFEEVELKDLSIKNQFKLSAGELYPLIRDKLQQICGIHRRFINNSLQILFKDRKAMPRLIQASILIISDHFETLCKANQKVCQLWQMLGLKTFTLKTENLNQFSLRELIPSNVDMPFRKLFEYMPKMFSYSKKIKQLYEIASYMLELRQQNHHISKINRDVNIKCQRFKRQLQALEQFNEKLERDLLEHQRRVENSQLQQKIQFQIEEKIMKMISQEEEPLKKKKKKRNNKKNKTKKSNTQTTKNQEIIETKPNIIEEIKYNLEQLNLLEMIDKLSLSNEKRVSCAVSDQYVKNLQNWLCNQKKTQQYVK